MSDPTRIRDGGSGVPEELRELFQGAERHEPFPPAAHAALSQRIAAIAATPAPLLLKTLPWLLGGVVVTAGVLALRSPAGAPEGRAEPVAPPHIVAVAASASSVKPTEPAPITAAEPAELPAGAEAPPRAPTSALKASTIEDSLKGEAQLLNRAHRALGSDPAAALTIAREHARRYPRGQLTAEREMLLVQALIKLGRRSEAEARGRELEKVAPKNIYEERLDKLLRGQ